MTDNGDIQIRNTTNAGVLVHVHELSTGGSDIVFQQTGGDDIFFEEVYTEDGRAILHNTQPGAVEPNTIVGDVYAPVYADIMTDGTIFNDDQLLDPAVSLGTPLGANPLGYDPRCTNITTPIASLQATTGTIGHWNWPVAVDVSGALYVFAGGLQDAPLDFLSVNLQGTDVRVLNPDTLGEDIRAWDPRVRHRGVEDPRIPGMVLFRTVECADCASLANGPAVYLNNVITNQYFEGTDQKRFEVGLNIDPYALQLDVFGDSLFVPFDDLLSIQGLGVMPEDDEDDKKKDK